MNTHANTHIHKPTGMPCRMMKPRSEFSLCDFGTAQNPFNVVRNEELIEFNGTLPEPVKARDCSLLSMSAGGEKRHPVVIERGRLREWVGYGWIDGGEASAADYGMYPMVKR